MFIAVTCINIMILLSKKQQEPRYIPRQYFAEQQPFTDLPEEPLDDEPFEEPETVPEFVEVPKFRDIGEDSVYADVLSHSQERPFGDQHGRATNVHETGHGIHSYLRNKYRRERGKRVNGFYCFKGRGAIVEEPNMRISHIRKFIPENLRSYRYKLYLVDQARSWGDTPLYIYDEWVAYVLGGTSNVDDVQNGRHRGGWTDGVSGCLGFSIYAVATCMAVKENDPDYWENNEQFRKFTIWMLRQAHETYKIGSKMEQFKWEKQDRLLNEFLTSSSAEPMRKFIQEHLEGVWLDAMPVASEHYWPHQRVELRARRCSCAR